MKRIKILFATILIAVFTLSLASCSLFGGRDNDGDKGGNNKVTDGDTSGTGGGNSENNDENKNDNDENDDKTDNVEVNGKKILIAYFFRDEYDKAHRGIYCGRAECGLI